MTEKNEKGDFKAGIETDTPSLTRTFLILAGFFWAYAGASTFDYNEAAKQENQRLGYAKNAITNPDPTKDMLCGIGLMALGVFWPKIRDQKTR